MGWTEQQKIESNAPEYLKNLVQIVSETGLRIYKELAPLRKEQIDLANRVVWIPDSKTANGVAEVPPPTSLRKPSNDNSRFLAQARTYSRTPRIRINIRGRSRLPGVPLLGALVSPISGSTISDPPMRLG
jgi:integrase